MRRLEWSDEATRGNREKSQDKGQLAEIWTRDLREGPK
jgi:hypothetical protein